MPIEASMPALIMLTDEVSRLSSDPSRGSTHENLFSLPDD
jgi:hypothetical protein